MPNRSLARSQETLEDARRLIVTRATVSNGRTLPSSCDADNLGPHVKALEQERRSPQGLRRFLFEPGSGWNPELGAPGERELREWLAAAYAGDFSAEDWAHTLGGVRACIRDERGIVNHAAMVPRIIVCDGRSLRAGYVEAVATRADQRRRGRATMVLGKLGEIIARDYDIGVLSTGLHDVYSPLGWERWRGASYVQKLSGRVRTAEDDVGLMVLRTLRTPQVNLNGDIVADWRDGDIW